MNIQDDLLLIIGGGPAGLGAAFEADRLGEPYILLEKNEEVGGLARTIQHGDSRTDIGPHVLGASENVRECIDAVSDTVQFLEIQQQKKIYFDGGVFSYPPTPWEILHHVDGTDIVASMPDYIQAQARRRLSDRDPESFDSFGEFIEFGVGERAAERFDILDYFEKGWGISAFDVPDGGIRANRVETLYLENLLSTISKLSDSSGGVGLYPENGMGEFFIALGELLNEGECAVRTDSSPTQIEHDGSLVTRVQADLAGSTVQFQPKQVISTIPAPVIVQLLDPCPNTEVLDAGEQMRFRSYVYLLLILDEEDPLPDSHVVYIADGDVQPIRAMEPTRFSEQLSPAPSTLFLEFRCWEGDKIWEASDQKLLTGVEDWLAEMGIDRSAVTDIYSNRREFAYPVPTASTIRSVETVTDYIGQFSNLQMAGRTGEFEAVNSTRAIEQGIRAVREGL